MLVRPLGRITTHTVVAAGSRQIRAARLATQIADTVQQLSAPGRTRIALILGGLGMSPQIAALARRPRIIIATPGRLIDHLDRGTAQLAGVSILVLDEADRMLDMGFAPQVRRILLAVPSKRQTMLFSATMPSPSDAGFREILALGLNQPARVAVDPPRVAANAEQSLMMLDQEEKTSALLDLLRDESGTVLVFTRTKHRADRVARQLVNAGHKADRIHSNRSQSQRQRVLDAFRASRVRILVATDIAARGIDVEGVAHVVNYDLPADPQDYVHRVGRTARIGRTGRATSFVLPEEQPSLRAIERLVGSALPALTTRAGIAVEKRAPHPDRRAPVRAQPRSRRRASARP